MEELDHLIAYLRSRLAATDYVGYQAAGFCTRSGMMEATCKQLVRRRLKGSGRQWSERGALAMAALLTHRHNQASGPPAPSSVPHERHPEWEAPMWR